MRKRIKRNAICSSENYVASKKVHREYLKEQHSHFVGMLVSGEIKIDVPNVDKQTREFTPKFKTITVFGKQMRVTVEEYNTHCAHLNL